MKKDNFVFIITDYGSFNNFLAEIAIKLCSYYNVHVICSDDKIIKTNDKFDYINLKIIFHFIDIPRSFSILKLLKTSFKIRKLILLIKPKLVHAHFTTGILPTIFFRFWNIKYIGTFHGLGMNSTTGIKRIMFFLIEHFCFNKLDTIILINDIDYNMTKKNYKSKTIKLNSQGLGCNINHFDKNKFTLKNTIDEKTKLGLENKFVITYVGRFVEFKGFDIVVKVFINLMKIFPNQIALLLIGGFDPIHETGLTYNEKLINCDGIIKIGFSSEIPKYLSITDIFFFPSKKEGLPVCVIESLSMGVPVLAFKERGITDLIENQFNGVLINSSTKEIDILEFSKIITNFVLNKEMLKQMSINAMSNREIYSRSHFVEKQFDFYTNTLNS
jgi:glycosyltransferase involved in cell wall biosynthesis